MSDHPIELESLPVDGIDLPSTHPTWPLVRPYPLCEGPFRLPYLARHAIHQPGCVQHSIQRQIVRVVLDRVPK
jgi:hypothetical protein